MNSDDVASLMVMFAFVFLITNAYIIGTLQIIKNDVIDIKYRKGEFTDVEDK